MAAFRGPAELGVSVERGFSFFASVCRYFGVLAVVRFVVRVARARSIGGHFLFGGVFQGRTLQLLFRAGF